MEKTLSQPIKNNKIIYENIRKRAQIKEMTIELVLYYAKLKDTYKMISVDLSKQQEQFNKLISLQI